MADVGLKDLLQAGVHFGHQTHRWNPKMRRYIFAERGGIYLIDLKKTMRELKNARELVNSTVRDGGTVLFVCTKPQLAEIVRTEAERCDAFYVTERWLGGMLTNFQTIKKQIRRLKELERGMEENAFEYYTKKEQLLLDREMVKLNRYLSGIKEMNRLPSLVYVVDANKEEIAVKEANRLDIPIVAIADTNADPDYLTVPIAGNDDAIRSVQLITRVIADEIAIARQQRPEGKETAADQGAYTYSSDVGEAEAASGKRKKRPKRRPRPEMIRQRRHAADDAEEAEDADEAVDDAAAEEGEEAAEAAGSDDDASTAEAETQDAVAEGDEADGDESDGDDAGEDDSKPKAAAVAAEVEAGGGTDDTGDDGGSS